MFRQEKHTLTKIRWTIRDCRTSWSSSLSTASTARTRRHSRHVSRVNLKKFLALVNLHEPLEEINIDIGLCFVEELIEILDREVKKLKKSRIPIVKVRWNSRRGPEFTWEREDEMKR
ncbi:hypothetical protein Tco_1498194, partial [Tanacetum coccineum]